MIDAWLSTVTHAAQMPLVLNAFSMHRPAHEITQAASLDWLVQAHTSSQAATQALDAQGREAFAERLRKVVQRVACGPSHIARRGHVIPDVGRTDWDERVIYDVTRNPHGKGTAARSRVFDTVVSEYFAKEYAAEQAAPMDLIHVTCTGYISPSGAQKMVASKGWGERTRVTHAYHMGCYAAVPALRIARGSLSSTDDAEARVDIVHTELCSLHLDPSEHSLEQLVVQSLFADGFIRYSMRRDASCAGLRLLALHEITLPDSADAMRWMVSDAGMQMTLDRHVPERIGRSLRSFVTDLFEKADLELLQEAGRCVFAIHPGGPRVIDAVQQVLELRDDQARASRQVLLDYGNMSSATLPHIWMRLADDESVAPGTLIASLAFGPGLTIVGAIFRKQ